MLRVVDFSWVYFSWVFHCKYFIHHIYNVNYINYANFVTFVQYVNYFIDVNKVVYVNYADLDSIRIQIRA